MYSIITYESLYHLLRLLVTPLHKTNLTKIVFELALLRTFYVLLHSYTSNPFPLKDTGTTSTN